MIKVKSSSVLVSVLMAKTGHPAEQLKRIRTYFGLCSQTDITDPSQQYTNSSWWQELQKKPCSHDTK